jgi:hypothetical protein
MLRGGGRCPYAINACDTELHTDGSGYVYVTVDPRTRSAVAKHYYCGWMSLMSKVYDLGRVLYG